jgi:hypothetical protein
VQTHLRLKDTTLNIFTAPAPFTTHQAPWMLKIFQHSDNTPDIQKVGIYTNGNM